MCFTGSGGYQNFYVFAPKHSSLILDSNEKVINLISIRISSVKIKPFDTILEPTITNLASGRVILKFNNSVLVQKSYIVCELNNCPRNSTNNFPVKIVYLVQMFIYLVKLVRKAIKSKFTCNGRGIASDGGLWSFGNGFSRNVIFGVDNTSSSHTDNGKNNFLVLGQGPSDGIDESTGTAENKFSINFSKARAKFCVSLCSNVDESFLHVNKPDLQI